MLACGIVFSITAVQLACAADVTVRVTGVHNDRGQIFASLCQRGEYLRSQCEHSARTAAHSGTVLLTFADVQPGNYAIQVFHDENSDGQLNRNSRGIPVEGYGFSNNATGAMGPPVFSDAEIDVDSKARVFMIEMKY